MLAVGAEGHGAVAAQPGGKLLVGAHQPVGTHGKHDGAQLVEQFLGAFGLGGDVRVEADERIAHKRLDEDILRPARQIHRGDSMPARATGAAARDEIGGGRLGYCAAGRRASEHITDQRFDGVAFGEGHGGIHQFLVQEWLGDGNL